MKIIAGECPVCGEHHGGRMVLLSDGTQECDTCEQNHTPARPDVEVVEHTCSLGDWQPACEDFGGGFSWRACEECGRVLSAGEQVFD